MNKIEKCPYCGKQEFIEGIQSGYAAIAPANKVFTFKQQVLYHVICLNCGAVVKSYVKEPQKIITKKNREIRE